MVQTWKGYLRQSRRNGRVTTFLLHLHIPIHHPLVRATRQLTVDQLVTDSLPVSIYRLLPSYHLSNRHLDATFHYRKSSLVVGGGIPVHQLHIQEVA